MLNRLLIAALALAPQCAVAFTPSTRSAWARPLYMSATAEEKETKVDKRLAEIRGAQQKLMAPLTAAAPSGSSQERFVTIVGDFMAEYAESAYAAGLSVDQYVAIIGGLLSNVGKNLKAPYKFDAFHQAIRGPDFDYYKFGNDFVDTLMMTEESATEGVESLSKIDELVAKGDNVILLANHQTEADPQILRLILEEQDKDSLAQKVIYVAGHKVTTDPLAIPFSMGCNLLCIHSKKHIANPPEQTAEKQAQNMATMSKLQELLTEGGQCVWVAPSGGRDRPVVEEDGSKEFQISSFDTKSVEMFRLIAQKAGKEAKKAGGDDSPTTHFFPVAMLTRKLVPPPDTTDSTVGEKRSAKRGTVGLSFGPEVTAESSKAALSEDASKDEQRAAFATAAEMSVKEMYSKLLSIEAENEAAAK